MTLLQFAFLAVVLMILGYFISIVLWNTITLPFSNPYNVVGKLTLVQYNPITNYLRWGLFVTMPSLLFLLLCINPFLRKIFQETFKEFSLGESRITRVANLTLILLVIIPIVVFIQKDFTTAYFDVFHEGVEITPAYNFINGKGIWTGTLFVRGAFNDLFTAILGWKLFGVTSIGAYRVAVDMTRLLIPLGLAAFLYAVWLSIKDKILASLTVQLMLFFYLCSLRIQNLDRREAPLLVGLALIIIAVSIKPGILRLTAYFSAGLCSALCAFYSLDTGIYFTALLLMFPVLAFLLHVCKQGGPIPHAKETGVYGLTLFSGVLIGWAVFYLTVGQREFTGFIDNFLYILHSKDLLDSYAYPFPNLITSFRFTFPMIILGLNLLVYLIFLLFGYSKNEGLVHGVLTAVSFLLYRSALGRSDITHVEYSSSFLIMVLGMNVVFLLVFLGLSKKILNYILVFLVVINGIFLLYPAVVGFNPRNILSFNARLNKFIHEDDIDFFNRDRAGGVTRLRQIFAGEKCVFSLTSEALTPYLLKKPSCGPIYISYFAAVDPVRESFFNDLVVNNPKYILYSSRSWTQNLDGITNYQRLPQLMEYINSHYVEYETVSDYWAVYVQK